ncbi:Protein of unknown function [Tistlia consotensis]|uniref:DUF2889 domain-containing protein n=1 Tax=Tistlia consotensis USBA 355 TaxID=560819 RepID=A0A1Y6BX56_9PROT|nr:DUF2889 domain-containing protein [Tistlia consotensis]SMF33306.1 Protein of unknown function [Tistlia consotensis USBA 355]SNR69675.1 Protein of unknown function [Tistlia consotensis]
MPLSPPVAREPMHTRRYSFEAFRRADGLWDIDAQLTDTKTYGFDNDYRGRIEAGEPLHGMWLRLTLDEDFLVHAIEAVSDHTPYAVCPAVTPNFQRIVGLRIGPGWRNKVRQQVGGVEGCTHLVEMLGALGTVAYQALYPVRVRRESEAPQPGRRPPLLGSCHAFAPDSPVVRKQWPEFYTGPGAATDDAAE